MDDLEYRRQVVINPFDQKLDRDLKQDNKLHQHKGVENQAFVAEQQVFEQQLRDTLNVQVPENLAEKILFKQVSNNPPSSSKFRFKSAYMMAATFSCVAIILILLFNSAWFSQTQQANQHTPNLPQAVLEHMHEDSHALDTRREFSKVDVNTILASMGGKLSDPIGNISYLSRCIMGKNMGLHLVVQTESGLVTVLILPDENIAESIKIADRYFSGVIIPSRKGGIAIIGEKPENGKYAPSDSKQNKNTDIIRQRVEKNLHWVI